MPKQLHNKDIGYNEFFESNRIKLGLEEFAVARVVAQHKGSYRVKNSDGEYTAKITGKDIFNATTREDYPAVGDWVSIENQDDEQAIIRNIITRQSEIKRKSIHRNDVQIIATNIDVAFIVESIGRDFNLNRLERYYALVTDGGVKATIILNKIDLISKEDLSIKLTQLKDRFKDVDILLTSAKADIGLKELRDYILKGKTYCFLGSSGVGKSSIVNKLLEENTIETREISVLADRGKHTTTSREMYFLKNGGIVIDNPGMREVGMTSLETGVEETFDDILELALLCKYSNCSHSSEPGCNVLAAIESGDLDPLKYSNYMSIKKESGHYKKAVVEKNTKNPKSGKFIKREKGISNKI